MHDTFEVWAQIVIPSILGAATLAVSVVAVLVSLNASRLAHAVERQREAAAEERAQEASKARLVDMAIREAKLLRLWVLGEHSPRIWGRRMHRFDEPEPPRSPVEAARIEARVELEQSVVPGAQDLFAITVFDIETRLKHVMHDARASEETNAQRAAIYARRLARTEERIRAWALDPEGEAPRIAEEYRLALDDQLEYLMFGEGLIRDADPE